MPIDFAKRRQVKHTSTVLEPPIHVHTLVKIVDSEDIANIKNRENNFPLEVNSISSQLQTQILDSQQTTHLFYTISTLQYETYTSFHKNCSYCHKTIYLISEYLKEHRDDEEN